MAIKTISNNNRNKKSNKHNKNKGLGHNNNINNNNNNENINNNNININNYFEKYSKIQTYNIQVGESKFCLTSESLSRDAPNFFTAAFFGYFSESKTTSIFIERDPIYFSMMVRYLRGYEVDWPANDKITMNNLLADVKYYGFEKLQILLEDIYEKNFPENIIPWKVLTYASESEPIVAINIKDIELARWNSHSLIYDTNPILKKNKPLTNEDGQEGGNNDDSTNDNTLAEDNTTNDENENNVINNDATANNNDQNNVDNIIKPNPDKGLYRLEIHGRDALATVTSNLNNGVKFENLTLKDSADDKIFRALTESFRTSEGSLTLTPSLKLPYLKGSCVEIDGTKYYNYNDLSAYCGVTTKGKPLYFEEIVIRIDDGAFLMRARAWTIPSYYASQPFVCPVKSRKVIYI
uniref:Potassium channel tetramerisation-type BTB domain-containing protein n=3 Tax=Rhizophagus irregularis TaxID=588596 RepID=U9UKU9_RHIID